MSRRSCLVSSSLEQIAAEDADRPAKSFSANLEGSFSVEAISSIEIECRRLRMFILHRLREEREEE